MPSVRHFDITQLPKTLKFVRPSKQRRNDLFTELQKFFANGSKFLKSGLKNGAVIMRRIFLAVACALTLSACGTAQGVMNGVGEVLNGMGNDARSIGSIFN